MNSELIWVLSMLVGAIFLFITNRVRMDVVALLIIILFVLSGTLTLPEALAGFSDPNVILIAALFVVGEGLVRTGIAYQVGDALVKVAGSSDPSTQRPSIRALQAMASQRVWPGLAASPGPGRLARACRQANRPWRQLGARRAAVTSPGRRCRMSG